MIRWPPSMMFVRPLIAVEVTMKIFRLNCDPPRSVTFSTTASTLEPFCATVVPGGFGSFGGACAVESAAGLSAGMSADSFEEEHPNPAARANMKTSANTRKIVGKCFIFLNNMRRNRQKCNTLRHNLAELINKRYLSIGIFVFP